MSQTPSGNTNSTKQNKSSLFGDIDGQDVAPPMIAQQNNQNNSSNPLGTSSLPPPPPFFFGTGNLPQQPQPLFQFGLPQPSQPSLFGVSQFASINGSQSLGYGNGNINQQTPYYSLFGNSYQQQLVSGLNNNSISEVQLKQNKLFFLQQSLKSQQLSMGQLQQKMQQQMQSPVQSQIQPPVQSQIQYQVQSQVPQPQVATFQMQPQSVFEPISQAQMQYPVQSQFFSPPSPNNFYSQQIFGTLVSSPDNKLKLINDSKQDQEKQVVAIIITMSHGGSYDSLFTNVQQKSQEGTRVLVYSAPSTYIDNLIKAYQGNPQDQQSKSLIKHVQSLHPDCVVFNWECCGGYSGKLFTQGPEKVMKFLKIIMDKGHMAMFSDFSLKALVNQWDQHILGPNPYVQLSEYTGNFQIRFIPGELKECPSAQLQIVGQMAQQGKCNILAAGGTIFYSVNKQNLKHQSYTLQVLSVVTSKKPDQQQLICKVGQFEGAAGHTLIKYPSGGIILTSMGHWIQLMKIDTTEKKLFQVAEKQFGKAYAAQMEQQYSNINVAQQKEWVSKSAVSFVQNQAPCSNKAYRSKGQNPF